MDTTDIKLLGIDRIIRRGTAETVESGEGLLFVRDTVSGAYMLACDDVSRSLSVLERHIEDITLLMTSNDDVGRTAFEKYGFTEKLECYQYAYLGEKPGKASMLTISTATASDLDMLKENYGLISPEEMEKNVMRGNVHIGYFEGRPAGFIGEHLEGSMGILYVFPEYRRMGFGTELENYLIRITAEKGFIPFGQVEKDNTPSIELQKKIGMTVSDGLIVWMWR